MDSDEPEEPIREKPRFGLISLALAALVIFITMSVFVWDKLKQDVWVYYTDDAGTRVGVEENKTRNVLWQDPQQNIFIEQVDPLAPEEMDPVNQLIHHFSSWNGLKRAVAWMLRLKRLLLNRSRKRNQTSVVLPQLIPDNIHQRGLSQKERGNLNRQENNGLTVEELANAEIEVICFCQRKRYTDEISNLRKGINVKRTSHLHKLNPIVPL